MPTDDVKRGAGRRRRGARAEIAGQQRHRVTDGHHLAEQRLRSVRGYRLGGQRRTRSASPTGPRTRSPATTSTVVFSRSPALDSVTSSSSAVPAGVPAGATPDDRGGGARTDQRHRIPLPNAEGGDRFRMQADHAAARCRRRGVQPGGQRQAGPAELVGGLDRSLLSGPACADPSRATERPVRCWARRIARRAARRCRGLASQVSGRAATQRWLRMANGMMQR